MSEKLMRLDPGCRATVFGIHKKICRNNCKYFNGKICTSKYKLSNLQKLKIKVNRSNEENLSNKNVGGI